MSELDRRVHTAATDAGHAVLLELAAGLADAVAWYRRHPERLAVTAATTELDGVSA
ncbi:hypothetical protein QRX60_45275 [Amycolatopsis mongoliensis]|uniref:Uncharacterized protein n=1 Tax=Amycolatopsis mongoliensis TaxID=715475 RepID=A0A9Y2NIW2_9PSEU|nr:hypothetical protein [Amycolatopsis sp. 4-36]WIY01173.1 hypothetical protein QRX60_45275 [Amycolatopsis sp. 4-36]